MEQVDRKRAMDALALCDAGLKGKAIGEKLGVDATTANALVGVGAQIRFIERARLTQPELLLILTLRDLTRELLDIGIIRSIESWRVAARVRKGKGWPSATANRRVFVDRWDSKARRTIQGLGFVHASRSGCMWLTEAGWALAHAYPLPIDRENEH